LANSEKVVFDVAPARKELMNAHYKRNVGEAEKSKGAPLTQDEKEREFAKAAASSEATVKKWLAEVRGTGADVFPEGANTNVASWIDTDPLGHGATIEHWAGESIVKQAMAPLFAWWHSNNIPTARLKPNSMGEFETMPVNDAYYMGSMGWLGRGSLLTAAATTVAAGGWGTPEHLKLIREGEDIVSLADDLHLSTAAMRAPVYAAARVTGASPEDASATAHSVATKLNVTFQMLKMGERIGALSEGDAEYLNDIGLGFALGLLDVGAFEVVTFGAGKAVRAAIPVINGVWKIGPSFRAMRRSTLLEASAKRLDELAEGLDQARATRVAPTGATPEALEAAGKMSEVQLAEAASEELRKIVKADPGAGVVLDDVARAAIWSRQRTFSNLFLGARMEGAPETAIRLAREMQKLGEEGHFPDITRDVWGLHLARARVAEIQASRQFVRMVSELSPLGRETDEVVEALPDAVARLETERLTYMMTDTEESALTYQRAVTGFMRALRAEARKNLDDTMTTLEKLEGDAQKFYDDTFAGLDAQLTGRMIHSATGDDVDRLMQEAAKVAQTRAERAVLRKEAKAKGLKPPTFSNKDAQVPALLDEAGFTSPALVRATQAFQAALVGGKEKAIRRTAEIMMRVKMRITGAETLAEEIHGVNVLLRKARREVKTLGSSPVEAATRKDYNKVIADLQKVRDTIQVATPKKERWSSLRVIKDLETGLGVILKEGGRTKTGPFMNTVHDLQAVLKEWRTLVADSQGLSPAVRALISEDMKIRKIEKAARASLTDPAHLAAFDAEQVTRRTARLDAIRKARAPRTRAEQETILRKMEQLRDKADALVQQLRALPDDQLVDRFRDVRADAAEQVAMFEKQNRKLQVTINKLAAMQAQAAEQAERLKKAKDYLRQAKAMKKGLPAAQRNAEKAQKALDATRKEVKKARELIRKLEMERVNAQKPFVASAKAALVAARKDLDAKLAALAERQKELTAARHAVNVAQDYIAWREKQVLLTQGAVQRAEEEVRLARAALAVEQKGLASIQQRLRLLREAEEQLVVRLKEARGRVEALDSAFTDARGKKMAPTVDLTGEYAKHDLLQARLQQTLELLRTMRKQRAAGQHVSREEIKRLLKQREGLLARMKQDPLTPEQKKALATIQDRIEAYRLDNKRRNRLLRSVNTSARAAASQVEARVTFMITSEAMREMARQYKVVADTTDVAHRLIGPSEEDWAAMAGDRVALARQAYLNNKVWSHIAPNAFDEALASVTSGVVRTAGKWLGRKVQKGYEIVENVVSPHKAAYGPMTKDVATIVGSAKGNMRYIQKEMLEIARAGYEGTVKGLLAYVTTTRAIRVSGGSTLVNAAQDLPMWDMARPLLRTYAKNAKIGKDTPRFLLALSRMWLPAARNLKNVDVGRVQQAARNILVYGQSSKPSAEQLKYLGEHADEVFEQIASGQSLEQVIVKLYDATAPIVGLAARKVDDAAKLAEKQTLLDDLVKLQDAEKVTTDPVELEKLRLQISAQQHILATPQGIPADEVATFLDGLHNADEKSIAFAAQAVAGAAQMATSSLALQRTLIASNEVAMAAQKLVGGGIDLGPNVVQAMHVLSTLGIPAGVRTMVSKAGTEIANGLEVIANAGGEGKAVILPRAWMREMEEQLGSIVKSQELATAGNPNALDIVSRAFGGTLRLINTSLISGLILPQVGHFTTTYVGNIATVWAAEGARTAAVFTRDVVGDPIILTTQTLARHIPFLGKIADAMVKPVHGTLDALATPTSVLLNPHTHAFFDPGRIANTTRVMGMARKAWEMGELRKIAISEELLTSFASSSGLTDITRRAGERFGMGIKLLGNRRLSEFYADLVDTVEQRQRIALFMHLVLDKGIDPVFAASRTKRALYDWNSPLTRFESLYLVKLLMFWHFTRRAMGQSFNMIFSDFQRGLEGESWASGLSRASEATALFVGGSKRPSPVAAARNMLNAKRAVSMAGSRLNNKPDQNEDGIVSPEEMRAYALTQRYPWWATQMVNKTPLWNTPLSRDQMDNYKARGLDVTHEMHTIPGLAPVEMMDLWLSLLSTFGAMATLQQGPKEGVGRVLEEAEQMGNVFTKGGFQKLKEAYTEDEPSQAWGKNVTLRRPFDAAVFKGAALAFPDMAQIDDKGRVAVSPSAKKAYDLFTPLSFEIARIFDPMMSDPIDRHGYMKGVGWVVGQWLNFPKSYVYNPEKELRTEQKRINRRVDAEVERLKEYKDVRLEDFGKPTVDKNATKK